MFIYVYMVNVYVDMHEIYIIKFVFVCLLLSTVRVLQWRFTVAKCTSSWTKYIYLVLLLYIAERVVSKECM